MVFGNAHSTTRLKFTVVSYSPKCPTSFYNRPKEIIEGSSIFGCFKDVFACEFFYDVNGVAKWPKNAVNFTTKTQYLFRINKGVLDVTNDEDLNRFQKEDDRPVPFRNMIYIGDGLTDVPCMRLVKANGGYSVAVYQEGQKKKVDNLILDKRVDFVALADYSENSELVEIVTEIILKMLMVDSLKKRSKNQIKEISQRTVEND